MSNARSVSLVCCWGLAREPEEGFEVGCAWEHVEDLGGLYGVTAAAEYGGIPGKRIGGTGDIENIRRFHRRKVLNELWLQAGARWIDNEHGLGRIDVGW